MSFSQQERTPIFSPLSRRGFLFPFLIIFLNALQVAVLHVDGDAVEFNGLWAKAERLSSKINEWQPLSPGARHGVSWLASHSWVHPHANTGWVPRVTQPSSTTHGSLINEVLRRPAIVHWLLSISRWPLVKEETNHLCLQALGKVSPSHISFPWASWVIRGIIMS